VLKSCDITPDLAGWHSIHLHGWQHSCTTSQQAIHSGDAQGQGYFSAHSWQPCSARESYWFQLIATDINVSAGWMFDLYSLANKSAAVHETIAHRASRGISSTAKLHVVSYNFISMHVW